MDKKIPDNFHGLYDLGFRRSRGTPSTASAPLETRGIRRLSSEIPDLEVHYDEATQLPSFVTSRQALARLSTRAASSPEEAVTQFIQDQGDLWNLSSEDVATVEVVSVSRKGLNTVNLIQRVEGKDVFNSEVTAAVGPNQEIISLAGQFFPGTGAARQRARSATMASTEETIAKAAFDLTSIVYEATDFSPAEPSTDNHGYSFYQFLSKENDPRPSFQRMIRVKEVMFPLGEGQFVPGYYMELWIKGFPAFSYVVDAVDTPDVLFRKNLTSEVGFKYRVHNTGDAICRPEDGPAPGTPHPTGIPDSYQAPTIPEKLIEIESLLPGDPWLPSSATTTSGNNCIAYADLATPGGFSAGDVFGTVTAPGIFDYTYDHAQPARTPQNLQNSLVGMFFHVNWLHDRWYEAGFDEASGNAQQDNYGRGGIGGDPILAEGLDGGGTDNANMATPADGISPRMQMYEFKGPSPLPSRTSNHEALITFHEMGHYITNRLIGNANGLTNPQGLAMGEGWGDFFAICMTSQKTDNFANGVFAVGGWTDLRTSFRDNYYFSIRRYPYSADMTKNSLTFKHISDGVVLPVGPPRNPNVTGPNNSVHNAGEVWCSALWEVFVNLVAKHQHEEAERRVLTYVIGGLKLTPSRPTFTQARDGIIAAVSSLDPRDLQEVWAGFAKRGMGVNAISPPASSMSLAGVVESFDTPQASKERTLKIVLFDLGKTLEDQDVLLPGAHETLKAIQMMRDFNGEPVILALVSDFDMPTRPEQIPSIQQHYYNILELLNIRSFFEPVVDRVTLSTEVGVLKPDERIFQAVIQKINEDISFQDIIFITENLSHIVAARDLGMTAIHFKGPGQDSGDVEQLVDLIPIIEQLLESSTLADKSQPDG